MYPQMRRLDRALSEAEARSLLEKCKFGILSTCGKDGQPYATPLSYVVLNDHLYFHCAKTGHKVDNIASNPRVCFAVVGDIRAVYDKSFTTLYESAIVYGSARAVEYEQEKEQALTQLCRKYLPDEIDKAPGDISGSIATTAVYKISIEHITGKAKR